MIAPIAIVNPAKSHPGFSINAVAARDKKKAERFAKKYNIPKCYYGNTGYQGQSLLYSLSLGMKADFLLKTS